MCNFASMLVKKLHKLLIITILTTMPFIAGAQAPSGPPEKEQTQTGFFDECVKGYYSQVFGIDITGIMNVDLYASIEKWLGTPYRYAGKSLEGIDCSSFVNKIYESAYCYLLTGNSADLFKKVTPLPMNKLAEGDLVFFKINRKTISHVGVYLGDNKFAHASRTKGVVISDLNHPYYKKYFVKGGRVNFEIH